MARATYRSRLPRIAAVLGPKTDLLAETVAKRVESEAKSRVSVDTGSLRDAIHVEPGDGRGEFYVIAGDREVFYGHIVEHGGVRTPARPFLVPAGQTAAVGIGALAKTILGDL